jgi:tetratricopeptide (TPR) repeat protein
MRRPGLVRNAGLLFVASSLVAMSGLSWADDLRERLERLVRSGRYDLALQLVEDQEQRGVSIGVDARWIGARLTPDPERFEQRAAELQAQLGRDDPRAWDVALSRAQEQFARGRYQTAYELLRDLPAEASLAKPGVALFAGMSAASLGEMQTARQALESVAESSAQAGMAQALLAELSLREGRLDLARAHAERARRADPRRVGAQALHVQIRVADRGGDPERARQLRQALLREFPRSAEAVWLREAGEPRLEEDSVSRVLEVEAPRPRQDFALQLGAFHDRRLALKLASQLAGQIPDLRIEVDLETEPAWYRVVAGRYVTRAQADGALDALRRRGQEGVVLSPGRSER